MKSLFLVAICLTLAFAQPTNTPTPVSKSCCAPLQWQGTLRDFLSNGEFVSSTFALDFKNNKAYSQEVDPNNGITFSVWVYETSAEKVIYVYIPTTNYCEQVPSQDDLNNFCVGGGAYNATYDVSVTIGSATADVYNGFDPENGDPLVMLADSELCVPIAIERNPMNSTLPVFTAMSLFVNIEDNVDNFPPLPSVCQTAKVVTKSEAKFTSRFLSLFH
eukprot:TRINITY_DN95_c0_g1_i1.p1 TRINITY_DN95_c0_g1~~TRINITY_DN95_c0_g1_i1.p1  ORF type:complete len:218 (+),score=38.86 TRINITY_DN95_c0_g1_i1:43-696(+)